MFAAAISGRSFLLCYDGSEFAGRVGPTRQTSEADAGSQYDVITHGKTVITNGKFLEIAAKSRGIARPESVTLFTF